jgi:NADH:ubiquinone oxidoreductase subunit E
MVRPLKIRRRKVAYANIMFTTRPNGTKPSQLCVFAYCQSSGNQIGPIWGHSDQSIRKALAELTCRCDCPAKFHKSREFHGKRVQVKE